MNARLQKIKDITMNRMTQWMAWALLTTSAPVIACATAHAQSAADNEDVITVLGARQAYQL